ncbi:MAG: transposase [Firmicutes bacterium]|nr:transposase [Bacillota bacterium]
MDKFCVQQSHLGKAVQYCLNQWDKLNGFLLDGRLKIDNNRAERSIKPFVIGRKNFLFSQTPKGAAASAMIYSMVESAKENNLKTYEYLEYASQRNLQWAYEVHAVVRADTRLYPPFQVKTKHTSLRLSVQAFLFLKRNIPSPALTKILFRLSRCCQLYAYIGKVKFHANDR